MEIAFSLGSNQGDRIAHMREAKTRMLSFDDVRLAAQSRLFETAPVDVKPEYAHLTFINAVLVLESPVSAREWLDRLHGIEREMGRVRGDDRNAPRAIDIDILYAGSECIDSGGLVVPHPRWAARRFVVEPLADVRPGVRLPGAGLTVTELLDALPDMYVHPLDIEW